MSNQETVSTAQRWFQGKRVPLYFVVGGSLLGAGLYLNSRARHPHTETNKAHRKDPVPEERGSMAQEGNNYKNSKGRQLTEKLGLVDGHHSDGIMPNTKIARKMGDMMGTNDTSAPTAK
ncbi:hypothetical protein WJX73_003402 [Symbiochloris irregularis]|uniref:Uncharacterized protein n=1 Tax=Symbiochloris irregularis TaxID=706552 RepID=A0AAW1P5S0_9CHLO